MSKRRGWFEVDRAGLAEVARRRGMAFIITEPIQNAWDEDITEVRVELVGVHGRPLVALSVEDDSPNGFRDMADSYMMFRSSYKMADPEQRGRFNIGEKLLLAVASEARIVSTKGSVIFGPKGRTRSPKSRESGTLLTASLRMTRAELEEALAMARTLIPPANIKTWINGSLLPCRTPLGNAMCTMPTEVQGGKGGFKQIYRGASVRTYEVREGETPHLYEMGIPVGKIDCPWHVEVMQKVPLSIDRGSVRPGFMATVQREVAIIMASQLSEEDARSGWVADALEYMYNDGAVRTIIGRRFGKAVSYDPGAPESNKLAIDAGYAVVHGGELTRCAWVGVHRAEALPPAGRVFPDGRVRASANGVPHVPPGDWTPEMERVAEYAGQFAEFVLGHGMHIQFFDEEDLGFNALCGGGVIALNVGMPDIRQAVDDADQEAIDRMLIHECAHDKEDDHLTHGYHRECCRIGARARRFEEIL